MEEKRSPVVTPFFTGHRADDRKVIHFVSNLREVFGNVDPWHRRLDCLGPATIFVA